jgi:hypothetical protein
MWLVFSLVTGVVVVAVPFFFMAIVSIVSEWTLSIEFVLALALGFSASIAVNGRMKRHQRALVSSSQPSKRSPV